MMATIFPHIRLFYLLGKLGIKAAQYPDTITFHGTEFPPFVRALPLGVHTLQIKANRIIINGVTI